MLGTQDLPPGAIDKSIGICKECAVNGIHNAEFAERLRSAEHHDTDKDVPNDLN